MSAESAAVTPRIADLAIEATILGLDGQPVAKSMVTFWAKSLRAKPRKTATGEIREPTRHGAQCMVQRREVRRSKQVSPREHTLSPRETVMSTTCRLVPANQYSWMDRCGNSR